MASPLERAKTVRPPFDVAPHLVDPTGVIAGAPVLWARYPAFRMRAARS